MGVTFPHKNKKKEQGEERNGEVKDYFM